MITSCLDYCNALLSGILDYQVKRLLHTQNTAAHVVRKIKKYDHITPTLEKLHQLPVKVMLTYQDSKWKCPSLSY